MANKSLLKFSLLAFCLSIAEIGAYYVFANHVDSTCISTGTYSAAYCSFNAFRFGQLVFAIPGSVLLAGSIIVLVVSFFNKGTVSRSLKITGITLCILIFIAPYPLYFGLSGTREKMYSDWQEKNQGNLIQTDLRQQGACLNYILAMKNRKATDPMPVSPSANCKY